MICPISEFSSLPWLPESGFTNQEIQRAAGNGGPLYFWQSRSFSSKTPGEKGPGVSSVSEPVKEDRFLTGGELFSA